MIYIAYQVRQCLVDTGQILSGEIAAHVSVGSHAHEHSIVLFQDFIDANILAHFRIETELDTHTLEYLTAAGHYLLLQLELGNPKGQQTANFRVTVKYHGLNPVTREYVGTA